MASRKKSDAALEADEGLEADAAMGFLQVAELAKELQQADIAMMAFCRARNILRRRIQPEDSGEK